MCNSAKELSPHVAVDQILRLIIYGVYLCNGSAGDCSSTKFCFIFSVLCNDCID